MIKETNIKQDYKKTTLGIIPEDWEVKRLEELSSHFKSGSGITSKDIEESGEYPVYGGNGLRGYTETFTHDGKYLLIGRQGALCGNIQRVKGKAYISEHAIAVQTNKLNDLEFLASKLEYYNLNRLSESSAQPGLAVNKLVRLKLPIPPLPEQKAIANCLSTWDKAIEKQTQLIEAKKEFKKGLMQGFFNGQLTMNNGQLVKAKEGEDFTEDWEALKIKDIGYIPKKEPVESLGNLKTLTVRLYTKGIDFNENAKTVISSTGRPYYQRYKNEILIGRQNIHNGGIGEVQEIHDGHICSNAISSFVINEDNDKDFILAVLMYPEIYKRFEVYMTGTGQKELSERQLLKLEIKVPTIKIQNSISRFLQSVDKEIELLEQKLSALQEQKKGLMQVLLTGEKRLV